MTHSKLIYSPPFPAQARCGGDYFSSSHPSLGIHTQRMHLVATLTAFWGLGIALPPLAAWLNRQGGEGNSPGVTILL